MSLAPITIITLDLASYQQKDKSLQEREKKKKNTVDKLNHKSYKKQDPSGFIGMTIFLKLNLIMAAIHRYKNWPMLKIKITL